MTGVVRRGMLYGASPRASPLVADTQRGQLGEMLLGPSEQDTNRVGIRQPLLTLLLFALTIALETAGTVTATHLRSVPVVSVNHLQSDTDMTHETTRRCA